VHLDLHVLRRKLGGLVVLIRSATLSSTFNSRTALNCSALGYLCLFLNGIMRSVGGMVVAIRSILNIISETADVKF
jgi:hypothetical protein